MLGTALRGNGTGTQGKVQLQESTFLFIILQAGTRFLATKCGEIQAYSQSRFFAPISKILA